MKADRDVLDALIQARHNAGISQSDLARRIGITPSAVNQLENNTRRSPTLHSLTRYANAIGARITIETGDTE